MKRRAFLQIVGGGTTALAVLGPTALVQRKPSPPKPTGQIREYEGYVQVSNFAMTHIGLQEVMTMMAYQAKATLDSLGAGATMNSFRVGVPTESVFPGTAWGKGYQTFVWRMEVKQ